MSRRIVVLGGTGHVGSYMCPILASDPSNTVICVSRGKAEPYAASNDTANWAKVQRVTLDREHDDGGFVAAVVLLEPNVVIDMICFTLDQCVSLVQGLTRCPSVKQLLHCGSIWIHGHSIAVPTVEDDLHSPPLCEYGAQKLQIQNFLLEQRDLPFSVVVMHPGHIVGRGWCPLNPEGHFDPAVFAKMKRGEEIFIPHFGMETVHHVHAADVAGAFIAAIAHPGESHRQAFHIVSPQAITLRGYAEEVCRKLFLKEAVLSFQPWLEFCAAVGEEKSVMTRDHIAHSPNCAVGKLQRLIGFTPQHSSLSAVVESVEWLLSAGVSETISFPGKQTSVAVKD